MIKNQNYEVVFNRDVDDLNSESYLLIHKKTGARVFILSNDDDNKVFMIGFRTPPSDSTGVAHITEHTVLCGSEKYPLKDPFVELAKGSLNTFLNAITYPDKTVYPIASRNEQDFKNIMSVYMDAVFHPNTYKYPEIMKQEGWYYKIEDPADPIEYNGVVYNEMKGAFSSPDSVLERTVMNSLFPDTSYGVESGGDPDHIPELTYEEFLDFHKKYYHPSNSYIYLYGDMDIEERLAWIDREYLKHYSKLSIDSEVRLQSSFDELHSVRKAYSITDDESEKDNTYLAYNFVCGDNLDAEKNFAMQMIVYALFMMQGAPIRQRLIDEGIGKDVYASFETDILQPYLSIQVKNSEEDKLADFIRIVNEEFEKAAENGLDKKSLKACLSSMKFRYREADFGGAPKGLMYGIRSMKSWLYTDYSPLMYIELSDVFNTLEEQIDTGYFEELVKEYFLYNTHASTVVLYPEKGLSARKDAETAEKLAKFKESLSEDEIHDLVKKTHELAEYQSAPEDQEDLETIPLLQRSDLNRVPENWKNTETDICNVTLVEHEYNTNGIAYFDAYFDVSDIEPELLPYLGIFGSFAGYVDSENYKYADLNNDITENLGGLSVNDNIITDYSDSKKFSLKLRLSFSSLIENIEKGFELASEVLFKNNFDDDKRLYEIISELKSDMQISLVESAHQTAGGRLASYLSPKGMVAEVLSGIDEYKLLERLDGDFENEKDKLKNALTRIMNIYLSEDRVILSCTGDAQTLETAKEYIPVFCSELKKHSDKNKDQHRPVEDVPVNKRYFNFEASGLKIEQKNEAFKTAGSVNYLAFGGMYRNSDEESDPVIEVFHTIMRYEYLWQTIRVRGGAYGCMSNTSDDGALILRTYRDPNLAASKEIFETVADYIENFDVDEREMTKFVIGTMSVIDPARTNREKGLRSILAYLKNAEYSATVTRRERIVDCTVNDVKALAPKIRKALGSGNLCAVGCETKVEEDKALFKEVKPLFE